MPSLACLFKFAEEKKTIWQWSWGCSSELAAKSAHFRMVRLRTDVRRASRSQMNNCGFYSCSCALFLWKSLHAKHILPDAAACSTPEEPKGWIIPDPDLFPSILQMELRCSWTIPDEAVRLRGGTRLSIYEPLKQSMVTSLWFGFKVKLFS